MFVKHGAENLTNCMEYDTIFSVSRLHSRGSDLAGEESPGITERGNC